ncbi:MAG: hypothetical protein P8130_15145 [Deltaproteobacteria bacterium]
MAHAADVQRGKKLFEDPHLGDGTTGKSCKTCHEDGVGLGKDLFKRDHYSIMGQEKSSIEEVVNVCIQYPLGGKPIDPKGKDMQDLVAYIRTLVERK